MTITNNIVERSEGTGGGVGFFNNIGNPELLNVLFTNNIGPASRGGASQNASETCILTNVVMQGNRAGDGGAWFNGNSHTTFNNVTIVGNSAQMGAGFILTRVAIPSTILF